jgi:hypothetical protein
MGNMKRDRIDVTGAEKARQHFISHANLIGLHVNGLLGLTTYADSQFELEWRRADFPEDLKTIARAAFKRAVDERVVREFPNHPLTKFSRDRLAD